MDRPRREARGAQPPLQGQSPQQPTANPVLITHSPVPMVPGPGSMTGAVPEQGRPARDEASAGYPRPADRTVKDAWLMKHPEFPKNRPGLLHAVGLGLTQAALSWHMHEAKTEHEHDKNKKIIIAEATNGALVAALFVTVTTGVIFDPEGAPQNGMEEAPGMVSLYFSLQVTSTFCFSMSILYSLVLLLIMESVHGKDASDLSHALGIGIHWPITNFVLGIFLLLFALMLKGYFDVLYWVWLIGIGIIVVMILIFFAFLGTAVQAQWDIMNENLRVARQDSSQSRYAFVGSHFGCAKLEGSIEEDIKTVQGWVAQLPEIDESTRVKLCTRFEDELLDVLAVSTLTSAEFAELGIFKMGWKKKLLHLAQSELLFRSITEVQ